MKIVAIWSEGVSADEPGRFDLARFLPGGKQECDPSEEFTWAPVPGGSRRTESRDVLAAPWDRWVWRGTHQIRQRSFFPRRPAWHKPSPPALVGWNIASLRGFCERL